MVLDGKYENVVIDTTTFAMSCISHEIILTDENSKPGDIVDKIAYIGFFVVNESTVITVGDEVRINGQVIGNIAGFDETHMPNHYNIVIHGDERSSGNERNLDLGDEVIIG